jgi:hypothetical protein
MAAMKATRPRTILQRLASTQYASTSKMEQAELYRKMCNELEGQAIRSQEPAPHRPIEDKEELRQPIIDICRISAAAFQLNLWKKKNTLFATSIFEIDRELEAQAPGGGPSP